MLLFCLPYAGGSEAIYYKWSQYLNQSIKLCPVALKGRGKRFNEPFYECLEEAIEDIFVSIKGKLKENEYAIFGHSMGSLLAYELYYKIKRMGFRQPQHIFLSGHRSPDMKKKEIIYKLPNKQFKKKIIELGGTPEELLNNNELFDVFIPVLKSDLKMVETYEYKEKKEKISCNISILNGVNDTIALENLTSWKNHTDKSFRLYHFDGNHFFIHHNAEKIAALINQTLVLGKENEGQMLFTQSF
ncbi:putative thioesterase [Bacillus siamensis]|uniref:thioesterase II family protein n=1 Tax=Bacillus siamensis TaxID=659243 RepID=UPI000C192FD4|nr:putative thioesterase [Bacillus siamensis]